MKWLISHAVACSICLSVLCLPVRAQVDTQSGSPVVAPMLNVVYTQIRLGNGIFCAFKYNAATAFEFPKDQFRLSINGLDCINTNDLNDPHFWHRNRARSEYRYIKNVPHSGPVSAVVNAAKQYGYVTVYNYANFATDDAYLPIILRMGASQATMCPYFDDAGSPWRTHKRKYGCMEQTLFVNSLALADKGASDNLSMEGLITTTNRPAESNIGATLNVTLNGVTTPFTISLVKTGSEMYKGRSSTPAASFKYNATTGKWRLHARNVALGSLVPGDKYVVIDVALQLSGTVAFDQATAVRARVPRKGLVIY